MEVQICRFCNTETEDFDDHYATCQNDNCYIFDITICIDIWNSVRMAPRKEPGIKSFVMNSKQCKVFYPDKIKMCAHFGTLHQHWMDAHYPQEIHNE